VHLSRAAPGGFALLLGHLWDRVPDTQTYEDLKTNGYEPAFLVRN
jgi:SMODS-associated and fused to various effectors sensor domain